MKSPTKIPKGLSINQFIDLTRYKNSQPSILNIYYQTNLLQIIDNLPQQTKKQIEPQITKTNINQPIFAEQEKNQMLNISAFNTQLTLTSIVMSYKHECDQLGNDTFINGYQITKTMLGKGSHSFVKLAKKQGKSYAIKTIAYDRLKKRIIIKDHHITKMINSQISFLIKLKCPYIIGFEQAIYLPEKQRVFIVLQFCSKGSILKYINSTSNVPFNQWQIITKKFMYQIALGLQKMHQSNVIHRDMKADNILITDKDQIRIIDFNISSQIPSNGIITITDKFIGTKTYAPPELLIPTQKSREVDGRLIDIWALGITYIQLLQRKHPFNVNTPSQLIKLVETPIILNKQYHPLLKDLLQRMLKMQNRQRIQINQVLKHAWFKI